MKYVFLIRIPSREILSGLVAPIEDQLNKTMGEFGFDEKVAFTTDFEVETTCNRELTDAELKLMEGMVGVKFEKQFPGSRIINVRKI